MNKYECRAAIDSLEIFIADETEAVKEYGAMASGTDDPLERIFWLGLQADERKHLNGLLSLKEEISRRCEK